MFSRALFPVLLVLLLFVMVSTATAQHFRHMPSSRRASIGHGSAFAGPGGFQAALGLRQYVNSFTSYQFPSPGTALNPISRLEWPWEQLFGVVKFVRAYQTFEVNFEASSTLSVLSRLRAQDSDWENEQSPHQKTTFSSGQAKPRGWTFDASTTIPLGFCSLKGVTGFRAQQFNFTDTDGAQWSIWDDQEGYVPRFGAALPGAGIEFSQAYKHWYGGGVLSGDFDLSSYSRYLPSGMQVRLQGDFGYVRGNNHDQHLRRTDALGRPQDRHTYETTVGHSWHVNLISSFRVSDRILLDVEADLIAVRTKGSHHWTAWSDIFSDLFTYNLSWDGALAWSEQKYISVVGKYVF
jgi:hypothetical protein